MPHLLLEYSAPLVDDPQIQQTLAQLHMAVCRCELFIESHIKLRAYPSDHYLVGGESQPFIHLQARIKPGRSDVQKSQLSEALLESLSAQPWVKGVITVEVVEMDNKSYAKRLI